MKNVAMRTLKLTQDVANNTHKLLSFTINELPVYSELSNAEEETYNDLIDGLAQCRFALELIKDGLVKIEVEG